MDLRCFAALDERLFGAASEQQGSGIRTGYALGWDSDSRFAVLAQAVTDCAQTQPKHFGRSCSIAVASLERSQDDAAPDVVKGLNTRAHDQH
ncbi:MAG: hypothetical protein ACI82G_001796, partial [Bradymonadia bacterium]